MSDNYFLSITTSFAIFFIIFSLFLFSSSFFKATNRSFKYFWGNIYFKEKRGFYINYSAFFHNYSTILFLCFCVFFEDLLLILLVLLVLRLLLRVQLLRSVGRRLSSRLLSRLLL